MSLFQAFKRFIQIGAMVGAAPYRLTDHHFETWTPATVTTLLFSLTNLSTVYRMIMTLINSREHYANKPFGYAFLIDAVFFINYSTGCYVLGGIFFSRNKLISHMNLLSDHQIMRNTYSYEQKSIRKFSVIVYGVLCFTFGNLLLKTVFEAQSYNFSYVDVILSTPLLISCALILVQFLVAVEVIGLSYGRIQWEVRTGRLTVGKLRQCCLLDIALKDYAGVVEDVYGPFNVVYIALSFLHVLTIELYIAEGGVVFEKAVNSYLTGLPPLVVFVWFIWKCTLVTREAENTLQCLHEVVVDVEHRGVREALELFALQLMSREIKLRAGGCFPLDFTLLYSMVGAVTSYVVTLYQFQAAFYS